MLRVIVTLVINRLTLIYKTEDIAVGAEVSQKNNKLIVRHRAQESTYRPAHKSQAVTDPIKRTPLSII